MHVAQTKEKTMKKGIIAIRTQLLAGAAFAQVDGNNPCQSPHNDQQGDPRRERPSVRNGGLKALTRLRRFLAVQGVNDLNKEFVHAAEIQILPLCLPQCANASL